MANLNDTGSLPPYARARIAAFGAMVEMIDRQIENLAPRMILQIDAAAPTLATQAATRECWQLWRAGILHFRDGGRGTQAGSLAGALEKSTLRSSGLAAGLGLASPRFRQVVHAVPSGNGHEEAVFLATRLIESALQDKDKSIALIRRALATPRQTEGAEAAFAAHINKQLHLSFNALASAYGTTADILRTHVEQMPPPPVPRAKGGQFKL